MDDDKLQFIKELEELCKKYRVGLFVTMNGELELTLLEEGEYPDLTMIIDCHE